MTQNKLWIILCRNAPQKLFSSYECKCLGRNVVLKTAIPPIEAKWWTKELARAGSQRSPLARNRKAGGRRVVCQDQGDTIHGHHHWLNSMGLWPLS